MAEGGDPAGPMSEQKKIELVAAIGALDGAKQQAIVRRFGSANPDGTAIFNLESLSDAALWELHAFLGLPEDKTVLQRFVAMLRKKFLGDPNTHKVVNELEDSGLLD